MHGVQTRLSFPEAESETWGSKDTPGPQSLLHIPAIRRLKMLSVRLYNVAIVLAVVFALAAAHGRMTIPTPRTGSSEVVKSPCSSTPTIPAANYTAGETITLGFDITASHGGTAAFYLSYDGTPASATRLGQVYTVSTTGSFSEHVQLLSNQTCTECLLEWIWESNEPTPYYGCATVTISAEPGLEPTSTSQPSETTTPPTTAVPPAPSSSAFKHTPLLLTAMLAYVILLAFY